MWNGILMTYIPRHSFTDSRVLASFFYCQGPCGWGCSFVTVQYVVTCLCPIPKFGQFPPRIRIAYAKGGLPAFAILLTP